MTPLEGYHSPKVKRVLAREIGMTKVCPGDNCEFNREPQPLVNFHRNAARYDGLGNYCKKCAKRIQDRQKLRDKPPVVSGVKTCSRCKTEHPVDNFKPWILGRDGRYPRCQSCIAEILSAAHLANREDRNLKNETARIARRERNAIELQSYWDSLAQGFPEKTKICKECGGDPQPFSNFQIHLDMQHGLSSKCRKCCARADKIRYHTEHESKWSKRAMHSIRDRSKKKGIPFDMGTSDLLDPKTGQLPVYCSVLPHIKLDYSSGDDRRMWASVDKIIPRLGYIKGNVRVISMCANAAKMDGEGDIVNPPEIPDADFFFTSPSCLPLSDS